MNSINIHNIIKIEITENQDMYPDREEGLTDDSRNTFSRHIKIHWHDYQNNINTTDISLFSTTKDDNIKSSEALLINL